MRGQVTLVPCTGPGYHPDQGNCNYHIICALPTARSVVWPRCKLGPEPLGLTDSQICVFTARLHCLTPRQDVQRTKAYIRNVSTPPGGFGQLWEGKHTDSHSQYTWKCFQESQRGWRSRCSEQEKQAVRKSLGLLDKGCYISPEWKTNPRCHPGVTFDLHRPAVKALTEPKFWPFRRKWGTASSPVRWYSIYHP